MMILTLNNLAKEYKLLPSEALARATTFDLYVLDVATKRLQYQHDIAEGKQPKRNTKLSMDQMQDMIKRAKTMPHPINGANDANKTS